MEAMDHLKRRHQLELDIMKALRSVPIDIAIDAVGCVVRSLKQSSGSERQSLNTSYTSRVPEPEDPGQEDPT